jgi:toxin ParE1/3/4
MKQTYEVMWAENAQNDLRRIISYIAEDSMSRALQILRKITKSASRLHQTPMRGRVIPELQAQGVLQYRELIVSPWRIIYRISEHMVFVVSVLDSRQNIEDILFNRLLAM